MVFINFPENVAAVGVTGGDATISSASEFSATNDKLFVDVEYVEEE